MVTGTTAAGGPTLADLAEQFRRLPVDAGAALSEIAVPAFILSRDGKIRWLNVAAIDLIGDRRGDHYSKVVAPESRRAVREQFRKKVVGGATARLGVVESAARNHVRGVVRELGVHSRLQAVIRGYQIGLLDIENLLPEQL